MRRAADRASDRASARASDRASDQASDQAPSHAAGPAAPELADADPIAPRRPTGLPLLLLVALALITVAGLVQVRARARVLGLGSEIATMTGEHSQLLDERRRLEAERAYLRHPDSIHAVAAARLHMIPAAPERTQTIHLADTHLADTHLPGGATR